MSYDVSLTIDTGGTELAYVGGGWNYTSNCVPMWRTAGADLNGFHGKPAGDCLPVLEAAIKRMEDDPNTFRVMDPPNGWGSYDTLLPALRELAAQLRAHAKATVEVSH